MRSKFHKVILALIGTLLLFIKYAIHIMFMIAISYVIVLGIGAVLSLLHIKIAFDAAMWIVCITLMICKRHIAQKRISQS